MRKQAKQREKGLSLFEVIFAMGVMSIGILAVVGVFPYVFRSIESNWDTMNAGLYAQQALDSLMGAGSQVDTVPHQEVIKDEKGVYKGSLKYWGEEKVPNNSKWKYQIIHVEMYWIDRGRTKIYKLTGCVVP